MNFYTYKSRLGLIEIRACENYIHSIKFTKEQVKAQANLLIEKAVFQIEEYLNSDRKVFDLPLLLNGTKFQEKVWNSLSQISYGSTCSYSEIANLIEKPKSTRAIGGALNKNPFLLVIPCHRVIGKNKRLTGYVAGEKIKQQLIELEASKL